MHLTKHHGLGNDFLVGLTDEVPAAAADLARRWCHRRRGIGADGLLFGTPVAGHDLQMTLFNADGSRAEMSGNGIRCFVQAVAMDRGVTELSLDIATDGGPRYVEVAPGSDPWTVEARVDMGEVGPGPALPEALSLGSLGVVDAHVGTADLGNPHLVAVVAAPRAVDLAAVGPPIEAAFPAGINLELIAPSGPDDVDLVVWERGVGITEACGTGACAAAHLAHRWGLVGPRVTVHMPGGAAVVELGHHAVLIGPSTYVGRIEVPDGC